MSVLKIVGLLKVTLLFYYYSNMRCWCLTERLWFNSDTFLCQVDKLTVVLISLLFFANVTQTQGIWQEGIEKMSSSD